MATATPLGSAAAAPAAAVVDAADLAALRAAADEDESRRETLIRRSRDVLRGAKHAIYSVHRGEGAAALAALAEARAIATDELLPLTAVSPALRPLLSGPLEELAEAVCFEVFMRATGGGRMPTLAECAPVSRDEYLGGLMDVTGELGRCVSRGGSGCGAARRTLTRSARRHVRPQGGGAAGDGAGRRCRHAHPRGDIGRTARDVAV